MHGGHPGGDAAAERAPSGAGAAAARAACTARSRARRRIAACARRRWRGRPSARCAPRYSGAARQGGAARGRGGDHAAARATWNVVCSSIRGPSTEPSTVRAAVDVAKYCSMQSRQVSQTLAVRPSKVSQRPKVSQSPARSPPRPVPTNLFAPGLRCPLHRTESRVSPGPQPTRRGRSGRAGRRARATLAASSHTTPTTLSAEEATYWTTKIKNELRSKNRALTSVVCGHVRETTGAQARKHSARITKENKTNQRVLYYGSGRLAHTTHPTWTNKATRSIRRDRLQYIT